jgi:hypothetical protein
MAFGLEHAIDERKVTINTSGTMITYWYDKPIFPEQYKDLESFEKEVVERFSKDFYEVYDKVHSSKNLINSSS